MSDLLLVHSKQKSAKGTLYDSVNFDDYDNFYTLIRNPHYQTIEICDLNLFSDVFTDDYNLIWKTDSDNLKKIYKKENNQYILLTPNRLTYADSNEGIWEMISSILDSAISDYAVDEELSVISKKTTDGEISNVICLNRKLHYHYKIIYGHFLLDDIGSDDNDYENTFIAAELIDGSAYGVKYTRNTYDGYWLYKYDDLLKTPDGSYYKFDDYYNAVWTKNNILKIDNPYDEASYDKTYTISITTNNCWTNCALTTINDGESLKIIIGPNKGYNDITHMNFDELKMGNVPLDVSTYYSKGILTIPSVTGNISIIITATKNI